MYLIDERGTEKVSETDLVDDTVFADQKDRRINDFWQDVHDHHGV